MWEYKTKYFGANEIPEYKFAEYLNTEGKERWELVYMIRNTMINEPWIPSNYTFIFKRRVE